MLAPLLCLGAMVQATGSPVNSVTDISHEFSFYMDGRFARQYIEGVRDARNWGTLYKLDLSNTNLLILPDGASPCPYSARDLAMVKGFLAQGGGVALLGDHALFRAEKAFHLNEVALAFGAEFVDVGAKEPVQTATGAAIKTYGGKTIKLTSPKEWRILAKDAEGRVVAAMRAVGRGQVLVSSSGIHGHNPDASDPINKELWSAVLRAMSAGKRVDPTHDPKGQWLDNSVDRGGLRLRFSDYMAPFADSVFGIYAKERPVMEKVLGVPPSPNMLTSLILLPTGGGGFSDGTNIALGVWWGDFPQKQYGMVELLGHEGTHSWVLPFAEPMWNEGLATYVGILVAREMGLQKEADDTLNGWIAGAKKLDPDMTKYDLALDSKVPHQVGMAKPMWIFEQLRKEKPDIVARYFQAKRRLAKGSYSADDSVAVLSVAMGRDLFPWFQSLGIGVDRSRIQIKIVE